MKFGIAEKYRLEIHWSDVVHSNDDEDVLIGCYLSGPVVVEVQEMEQADSIALDFGNQYKIFVPQYYVARLSWRGVKHTPNKIYLDNVDLVNKFTNYIPKLNRDDFIVVDTKNHTDIKHEFYLTYAAYLINKEGDMYNFRG